MSVSTVGDYWPVEVPVPTNMVRRISNAIRRIGQDEIRRSLLRDGDDEDPQPLEVCDASLEDWNRYVKSPHQEMRSRFMEWRDGKIWIVEYPGEFHDYLANAFETGMIGATGTLDTHLTSSGSGYNNILPVGVENEGYVEPDCSFGPRNNIGAILPPGVANWQDFNTVKVEIGVCQDWNGLDRKAAIWRRYPGVEYILLVRVSNGVRVREYRFEQRVGQDFPGEGDPHFAPTLSIDQPSMLEFDAHRLLGLPAGAALPNGFNDPVYVDLFERFEYHWQVQRETLAAERLARAADQGGAQAPVLGRRARTAGQNNPRRTRGRRR